MNAYDRTIAESELSNQDWVELQDVRIDCPIRYGYYRRRYPLETKAWCIASAKNWGKNKHEQEQRRKSHGTGAT